MRSPLFTTAVLLLVSLSPLHAEDAGAPNTQRGFWPALQRTWRATVNGADSAVKFTGNALKSTGEAANDALKATGSAVKSTSNAVVGVFNPSSPKAPKKLPIQLDVICSPSPVALSQTSTLQVVAKVFNSGKRTQLLEFASSQRVDAVLRDGAGKIVSRASEGMVINPEASLVTINPGERLEYTLHMATRGMVAGQTYVLEVAVLGQAGLVTRLPVAAR